MLLKSASMKWSLRLMLAFLSLIVASPALCTADPLTDPSAGILGNLYRTSKSQSRSLSPENFTGEKGGGGMAVEGTGKNAARDLGLGWKISPSVVIKAGSTFTLGCIQGPGCIQQIWMTPTGNWRRSILRFYWDGETEPSVECPVGDFFACGWGKYCQINSLPVCVNPGSAFNCYWPMPFRKSARITLENTDDRDMVLYYQVNYRLADLPKDTAYFHAQFRQEAPLQHKGLYTIADIEGQGQYVGTYLAWETLSPGWWGEGEIKFYMDGDKQFPTICGTGTEDYFCGSYDFENPETKKYQVFSTPYSGLAQVIPPDQIYEAGQKFGLYRWHLTDPVRFQKNLKVTIQALSWQNEGRRYVQREDNISSVAYWYQKEPHKKFSTLPSPVGSESKQ
jgi:Protein of unknown function (DUF2961)